MHHGWREQDAQLRSRDRQQEPHRRGEQREADRRTLLERVPIEIDDLARAREFIDHPPSDV
jgi:hypothetical protein